MSETEDTEIKSTQAGKAAQTGNGTQAGKAQAKPAAPELGRNAVWIFGQTICRLVTTIWFQLKVYGKEHVPTSGGVLLISNHQSYLDPIVVAVRLRRPVNYFAKSELFKNGMFAWLIRKLGAFPVRMGQADREAMRQAITHLQSGAILNVYPEGTRTADGELSPIQSGIALMVQRAPVPVVPVMIEGAFEAYPLHAKFPRPRPIHVMYGPALDLTGVKKSDIPPLIERTFRRMQAELRAKAGVSQNGEANTSAEDTSAEAT